MKRLICVIRIVALIITLSIVVISCAKTSAICGRWQDSRDIVEFNSDGTFTSQVYFMSGKYIMKDNKITMSIPLIGNDIYEFSIKDDKLTLSDTESSTKYTFTKVK